MRTTLTLDADVALRLRQRMDAEGVSFKQAVNDTLRAGFGDVSSADISYPSHDLGRIKVDLTHALRVAAALEDDEVAHELAVGR